MTFYIADSVEDYVVAKGFKTEEEAERYIFDHPYMKQYWYRYDVRSWSEEYAYGVTWDRDSREDGETVYILFATWDDAVEYVWSHSFELLEDFDFEDDIYQIDMTKGE